MSVIAIILGVAAAASFVLWTRTGRTRPNGEVYHLIPGTYGWFLLVSALVAYFWPSIQDGPVGPHAGLFVAGWVLAALVVAVVPFLGAVAVTAVVAIVAMLVGPVAPVIAAEVNGIPSSTASASPTTSPSPTVEPTLAPATQVATTPADVPATYPDRYLELLRKHGYTTETVDGQTIPVFVAKSTKYEEKLWTDAVCLPVKDREAVLAMVLGSPDCAAQVASGLHRLPVLGLDGKTKQLGDISPWLAEWSDPSTLNDWAQSAMESKGADRIEYARKLVLIAVQLERFTDGGVEKGRETSYNFHTVVDGKGGALSVDASNPEGAIPEFELSPKQYKGDFVIFRVTYKGYKGCWAEFGVNIGDGRFAGFTCEKPKPTEKPSPNPTTDKPNPEPTKPGPGPSTPPTTAPPKTPEPTPTPTPTPSEPTKTPTPTPTPTPSLDKPDEKNPSEPPAVKPTTQPDPIESKAPKPKDPIVPSEKPGDPISPKPDKSDKPAVPVPDNEDHPRPADPPKEDKPNTPPKEDPGKEIPEPDAPPAGALLVLAPFIWEGIRRLRRAA